MFWALGSIYGATAVAFGAFGAHGLKKRAGMDAQKLASWNTAAHYQLVHSGMILLTAAAAPKNKVAAGLFAAGITCFSGSIYLLTLDPQRFRALGPVTPIGGLFLIGGWVALAVGSRGRILPKAS
ncbi:unnamed protein product [Aureobasidium pullulans]|uniref:DUF423-domain-containing protein n=2 Tax=Aureobasidium pullulans TaxID=5580 RepID=A0A074XCJ5_AURPU|nr:DUF423-domain-containing protein [Aureobasidium pullulans EXF-150]KAG2168192.1 hypothetical protein JADG_007931 [Aureobasidium pullulans]KEQ81459.1 DUF423-domain-containing protein [Aureobasidium pullulans EXF-150]OBW65815.1 MAG: Phospholipase/carboxylesterase [Aureobasidium pullulans]THV69146.1 DUF423-domain-containing protein [Aureobasidium pullulans]THV82942.1 DUF423-domain-containing protein [Aureobasidium pullulans]